MQEIDNNIYPGAVATDVPEEPKLSLFQKIGGVIYSPGETMKSIAAWPDVLWPILFVAVFPLLLMLAKYPVWMDYYKKAIDIQMKMSNTTIPQDAMGVALTASMVAGFIGTAIGGLLMWVITSAVLMGLSRLFGGKGKFKQFLAVAGYAYIIQLIIQLIGVPMGYVTNSPLFDISLRYFTPNLLVGMEKTFQFGFLYSLLSAISLFGIWYYAVLAIGISAASKVNVKKILWIVFGAYVILTILSGLYAGFTEAATGAISANTF